ncbi:MAG TPA: FxLYD domain-containing protein [Candidatus Polarisedimenticolia bacterium]|jgi:hypothetical protein
MRQWIRVLRIALVALAAALPASGEAAIRSQRMAFVRESPADLSIAEGGIRLVRYRFSRLIRGTENPFKVLAGGPSLVFDVRNDGKEPRDFAVAVALFDGQGTLLGAGTQSHTGKLDPGESNQMKVVLKDVNQDVSRAATLFVALETRR